MGKSCCAIDCTNSFSNGLEQSFYRLPKAIEKRRRWIAVIRRDSWNPGTETWVCSSHFVSGNVKLCCIFGQNHIIKLHNVLPTLLQ